MSQAYSHLLSPLKVGGTLFRNRMAAGPSMAHFLQGPESYPNQPLIEYFAEKAKSGAAYVTVGCALPKVRNAETAHAPYFDLTDVRGQNYFCHLTEAIHFHGAKASLVLEPMDIRGWDCSDGIPAMRPKGAGFDPEVGKEMPEEMILDIVEKYAQQAVLAKQCGFDMVMLHASYRFFIISRFLSPLTNKRTDAYGGSRENRVRFLKLICTRIKELCGRDFLIEATISGREPKCGIVIEDVIDWCKMLDGLLDIIQVRAGEIDPNHPTGYCQEVTPYLKDAAAVKASNPSQAVAAIAGFQDLNICEKTIAEGKADFIVAARAWISNPDWGQKAYEGRNEDIVPCIRCNKCHISARGCTSNSVCSVNPTWGSIAMRLPKAVSKPEGKKKIAVIGGGPSGMEAALIASGRGHSVTLYEKADRLGGQLLHADNAKFKWPLRNFKNYLVRQVYKSAIEVRLNVEASPAMLRNNGYNHVIVAIGPMPIVPRIPGLERLQYWFASDIFMHDRQSELAGDVVIIGGGDIGTETGLYLAEAGHRVFVIEMQEALCIDTTPVHYRAMAEDYWLAEKNFSFAVNARCTEVTSEGVRYIDANAQEQFVRAGSIVLAAGMRPCTDEAMAFYGISERTTVIGDCDQPGSVQRAMRTGYAAGVIF